MIKRTWFLTGILCAAVLTAGAQMPPMKAIPNDPEVRVGTLPNGLTYYIRHNAKPAKQAEFYIVHNVGAIQEDTAQNGLAHFLEHMAFNGTKNFPGKGVINYMETIGVKFGANLNAMTGQETTIYNMSAVPLLREGIIDSCLLVLHDWSYFVSLVPSEIDNERGVIIEELRGGNTGPRRVQEALMPVVTNKSKYSWRNVIGTEAGLRTFSHQELVDFYHKWYRTDLQAIIVVGDFDVDMMERKIKAAMADIPAVVDPTPKEIVAVPDNNEVLVGIATDPEVTSTGVQVYIKRQPVPREIQNTEQIAMLNGMIYMATNMASNRLSEMSMKPNAPFLQAVLQNGDLTSTCDVLYMGASARDGQAATAFEAIYTELMRIKRHGFTESEFERVKANILRGAEMGYEARNDRQSGSFVQMCMNNFLSGNAMPDARTSWQLDSTLVANADLNVINRLIASLITDENQVVTMSGPSKSPMPAEADVRAIIARVKASEIAPYADNTVKEPLVSATLKGSPVQKSEAGKFGSTVWTLKNGVRVILKPTDLKADELIFSASCYGGRSLLTNEELPSGEMLGNVVGFSGVGKFSSSDLRKQLTGKAASMGVSIGGYSHGLSGGGSVKDLETTLQLLYLYFTAPRFDRGDYETMMDKVEESLVNAKNDPGTVFKREFAETYYQDNFRAMPMDMERLAKVKFEMMQPIYRRLFSNADDFTFVLTGSFDPEKIKPLIEKYMGSLPVGKERLTWKDDKIEPVKGNVERTIDVAMQTPKSTVLVAMSADIPFSLENSLTTSILKQLLDIRYQESIREEKGGTYGVGVQAGLGRIPKNRLGMTVSFDTDPAMVGELLPIVFKELREMVANGPKAEDIAKIKEFMFKQRAEALKNNPLWASAVATYYMEGLDVTTDYEAVLKSIDGEKVTKLLKSMLDAGNTLTFIMNPEVK